MIKIDKNKIILEHGSISYFCYKYKVSINVFNALLKKKEDYFNRESKAQALFKMLDKMGYII